MSEYKVVKEEFASIRDLVKTIEERPVNTDVFGHGALSSDARSDRSWYMTESFADAKDKLFHGWTEPVQRIKSRLVALDKLLTTESLTRSVPRPNMVGHAPSVTRYLLNLPMTMIDTTREPQKQRTISILYGFGGLGFISGEALEESGIALLAGIAAIERLGIRVRLDIVRASTCGDEIATFRLMVKDYCQPLDIHKCAFPLCNPSMQRRIAFGWLERQPDLRSGWGGGYGSSLQNNYGGDIREAFDKAVLRPDEVLLWQDDMSEVDNDVAEAFANAGVTVLKERTAT